MRYWPVQDSDKWEYKYHRFMTKGFLFKTQNTKVLITTPLMVKAFAANHNVMAGQCLNGLALVALNLIF